jgi:predicted ATPase
MRSINTVGRTPLVGRSSQLSALTTFAVEVGAGQLIVAVLSGAPGVGKTRLLEAFPPPERRTEFLVLRGGASQAEGMPPYLPFLEALGSYFLTAQADKLTNCAPTSAHMQPPWSQRSQRSRRASVPCRRSIPSLPSRSDFASMGQSQRF